MLRQFETHTIRPQQELSETLWQFRALQGALAGVATAAVVPSCWETLPGYEAYRGEGIYSRKFTAGGNLRLEFKGVSHTASVRLDGTPIAHHYNAYTPFAAIVPGVPAGEHTLEVQVDNRFSPASALHTPNDYTTYGGIIRPVALEQLGDYYIKWVHYTPQRQGGLWQCAVEACVCAVADAPAAAMAVEITIDGTALVLPLNAPQTPGQECRVAGVWQPNQQPAAWSPQAPRLYTATARLLQGGSAVDDLIDRIGFREIRLEGRQILLNGERICIKGFCRHEDMAGFGCALPVQAMQRDLALMKDMGANSVRTTHYPNDERFLDLCDAQGILVWEENHARGLGEADMRNPNFAPQCEQCNAEMVENHYNHPSIYIWGILNECASETEYGRGCYQKQLAQLRSLDKSRPLSFATCRFAHQPDGSEVTVKDICMDLPDVVAYNIYPLWYFDIDVSAFLRQLHGGIEATPGAGKPFLISEVGAGAVYGCHDPGLCKWSEEYQADALEKQLTAILADPLCSGVYIWQFGDVPVSREWFAARPRSHNNKGVVDEHRHRKLAYATVKRIFTAEAQAKPCAK
ncbi:MAG: glycoside hydrolase family 2 TIM barrel-domain containing protein [Pygmaiobacter sp.]|nr:glycoside hydrolase family 2 TIM barrel-domain containing protein [Pygmaiobacter sp.]